MSTDISVPPQLLLERILSLEIVRVTERAAVSAARLRGHGNEKAADQAAVDAMRRELNKLPIDGTVVIGEGERDEAPMLFIGEKVGTQGRPEGRYRGRSARRHDAVRQEHAGRDRDHGDGRRRHAAARARRLHGEDRDRPGLSEGRRRSRRAARREHPQSRQGQGRRSRPTITALVLDRPRHADIIAAVRKTGAAVRLITDGDVAGVIHCADPDKTGIDIYLGTGGAPEGVLAAAALRCIGGQMQCRLILDTEEKRERAAQDGHQGSAEEIRASRTWCAATACSPRPASPPARCSTGVKFRKDVIETETVVMRSVTGTVRCIKAEHRQLEKFHLD